MRQLGEYARPEVTRQTNAQGYAHRVFVCYKFEGCLHADEDR